MIIRHAFTLGKKNALLIILFEGEWFLHCRVCEFIPFFVNFLKFGLKKLFEMFTFSYEGSSCKLVLKDIHIHSTRTTVRVYINVIILGFRYNNLSAS